MVAMCNRIVAITVDRFQAGRPKQGDDSRQAFFGVPEVLGVVVQNSTS